MTARDRLSLHFLRGSRFLVRLDDGFVVGRGASGCADGTNHLPCGLETQNRKRAHLAVALSSTLTED
jgi:hypothetical protein